MLSNARSKKLILTQHKDVAMTVDKPSNIYVAAKKLQILKHGCFTHILNPAAQEISTITTGPQWSPDISVPNDVPAQM